MVKHTIKKGGHARRVYIPNSNELSILRDIARKLPPVKNPIPNMVHGIAGSGGIAEHARQHIGFKYTISMDLKGFYDQVNFERYKNGLANQGYQVPEIVNLNKDLIFPDGAASAGLPTSPLIANMAIHPCDAFIHDHYKTAIELKEVMLTRYCDDIIASCNDNPSNLMEIIRHAYNCHNWQFNESKTRIQSSIGGRRIITGIAVDDTDIYIPRKTRRKLRVRMHQGDVLGYPGLMTHIRLKPKMAASAEETLRHYFPELCEENHDTDATTTGEPATN